MCRVGVGVVVGLGVGVEVGVVLGLGVRVDIGVGVERSLLLCYYKSCRHVA